MPSLASLGFRFFSRVFRLLVCDHLLLFYTNKSGKESTNLVIVPSAQLSLPQCLKITKKVSFNFASEASYVYKVNENAKSGQIAAFTEHCYIHWESLRIAKNCWELLRIDENCWELLSIAENCWELLRITENYWELLSITEYLWKLLSIAENYWALLQLSLPKNCWELSIADQNYLLSDSGTGLRRLCKRLYIMDCPEANSPGIEKFFSLFWPHALKSSSVSQNWACWTFWKVTPTSCHHIWIPRNFG